MTGPLSEDISLRQKQENGLFYLAVISILILRLCSYFMLSEAVIVTQAFKVILRLATAGWSMLMLTSYSGKQKAIGFTFEYALSPLLYSFYLLLGTASLFWTSSFNDSLLHLLMDAETLLFSYIYIKLIISRNNGIIRNQVRISKITATSIFIICTGFIIGMMINPEKFYRYTHGGEEARLGGFIINPNELGMLIVIGIATSIIELKHAFNKWSKWVMMALLLYSLLLTGSRSSMIGLLLIILYFATQSKTVRMRLLISGTLLLVAPYVMLELFIKQGNVEEVLNMTGRIPFWRDLLSINFPREPLLGYGYMRIDYSDKFESISSYAGAMTHNTFLQVLIGLGLVGLFIVLAQLATTIHAIVVNTDKEKKRLCIALFIPVMINSFTEFGVFGETNYGILMYLFIVFSLSLKPVARFVRIKPTHVTGSNTVFGSAALT